MTIWDGDAFRASIQRALDEFLGEMESRLAPLGPDASRLLEEARGMVSGGKRFRAAFCYWGYRAVQPDVEDERALLRACAALELLHASALVHDDYMDASDTRRGRPATHRGVRGRPPRRRLARRPRAVRRLGGDPARRPAAQLGRRAAAPVRAAARTGSTAALDVFDLCRSEVIAGQFLDVSAQARGRADVDTAMTVLRYKSAKYSIERPLHVGAALAGAGPGHARRAHGVRAAGGRGVPAARRPARGVRRRRRPPASRPATTWWRGSGPCWSRWRWTRPRPEDAALLDRSLGTPLDADQVERMRRIIDDSGAHAQVESVIRELVDLALAALDKADVDEGARGVLREPGLGRDRPGGLTRLDDQSALIASEADQSTLGTPGRSGPSPRSSTANGPPRSALTRPPSTLSATENAWSSWRQNGL